MNPFSLRFPKQGGRTTVQKPKAPIRREPRGTRVKHPSPLEKAFPAPIDLQTLLSNIPLGIALVDAQRRIGFLNHAMEGMIGLTLKEAQGLPCFHVLRNRICIQHCPAYDGNLSGEPICVESDLLNRDRKRVPIRVTFAPVYGPGEIPIGHIETVEDLQSLQERDENLGQAYSFGHIIGKSPQMEKLFRILPVIAQSDSSVLLTGETGTGKDLIAEALHQASNRCKGPFIKVNCGALPETLLESELFGHKKGAFTGAVSDKRGRFHLAHNGTLYLTEIGDLPLPLQVKLLTFLDDKTVFPLGSTKAFAADVRIIAATHHDLENMVKNGRFREDLFFRLNVLRLQIPPLRERKGDIRLLLDHFLNTFSRKFNIGIKGFSAHALRRLMNYPYPGNVRELKNIVEYTVNICREDRIYPKHLPSYLTVTAPDFSPQAFETLQEQGPASPRAKDLPSSKTGRAWPDMEMKMITDALVRAKGNRGRAAALLGWARSTLWRKMKSHGMDKAC